MRFKFFFVLIIALLTLCSCSNVKPSAIEQPIPYSFIERVDPNSISEEYANRLRKYDKILDESPIPIFVIDIRELASKIFLKIGEGPVLLKKVSDINILGMYFYGNAVDGFPEEFIFINKALTPEQIMVTYFHERGHHNHHTNKCKECASNPVKAEFHAFYNELEMGWKHDVPHVLESSVRTMAMYVVVEDTSIIYKMAVFEVMKTDLWKKTMPYLILWEKG